MRRLVPTLLMLASASVITAADVSEATLVPPLLVTADRQPTDPWRSTATSAVVTSGDDRERGYTGNLAERIDGLPGVSALGLNGNVDGGISSIRIRGANSYDTRVLIDGIPVADPTNTQGQANTSFIDGSGIERIEVVNGAQSGLYGSNSGGGVVNLLTVRPTAVAQTAARVEGGSFGTGRVNGTTTGPIGEAFGYAVAVGAMHSDGISNSCLPSEQGRSGDHERDAVDRLGLTARVEAHLVPGTILYLGVRSDLANQAYDGAPPPTYSTDPEDDSATNKFRSWRGSAGGESHLGIVTVAIDGAHTDSDRTNDSIAYAGEFDSQQDYLAGRITTDIVSPGAQRAWAIDRLGVTLGADVQRDQAVIEDSFGSFDESDSLSGGWGQVLIGNRYVELSQSARIDHHNQEGNNGTWRSGVAVFPLAEVKLHASLATGFRAPSLYELYSPYGNPELQAQHSRSSEFGHETHLPGSLTLSNVAFRTDYLQAIEFVPNATPPNFGAYGNTGAYHNEGVESAIDWRPEPEGARLSVSWTWQHANADSVAHMLELPRNRVVIQPAWYFHQAWVSLRANAVSHRFADNLPGYALLGAAAGYTINPTWEVYVRGENLTNTAYELNPGFAGTSSGYTTPGAAGYGGVTATF